MKSLTRLTILKNLEIILSEFDQFIGHIIFLNVSKDIIKKRIMGRMTCDKCNMTFDDLDDLVVEEKEEE